MLHGLAVRGLAVVRERDGGGVVPASTAALLRMLAAEGRGVDGGSTEFVTSGAPSTGVSAVASVHRAACVREVFTASEAAAAWSVTSSYVRRLCRQGDVAGAVRADEDQWTIPASSVLAGLPRR